MIRHVQNLIPNSSTARVPQRHAAKAQAETNPFRSVLDSTRTTTPTQPILASAVSTPAPQIQATITKAAEPVGTLSPPHFKQNATATNPDGSVAALNWTEFADSATAQQIAAKLGGTVDESFTQGYSASQLSVRVPGSPNLVNAGIAAHLFAQYGDKPGSLAWQVINRDLGRDPMST